MTSDYRSSATSNDELSVDMMTLGNAVPVDEMPQYLQERIKQRPPSISVDEVRDLDADQRAQVLEVLERALSHYREQAKAYRHADNPDEHITKQLAMFLEAAQK